MSNSLLQRAPSTVARYWLVLSLLLVLLPHLLRLPLWLSGAVVSVIIWRLLRDYRDWPLPGKLLRLILTLLGIGAVVLVFRTILGREPGTALLTVLLSLKLLELRTLRDAMVMVFLGYFLVAADFLFDESIASGLYLFGTVLALTASLIVLNHPGAGIGRTTFYLQRAALLLLQSLPMMALLFLLFPRIESPLWRIPEKSSVGLSGLSDEMQPGDITKLVLSDELVFRVEFTSAIPAADRLYWRGPVLWQTDGQRWLKLSPQQLQRISSEALDYTPLQAPLPYTIMLEPQSKPWLFALDLPVAAPQLAGGSRLLADFQLLANQPVTKRLRYTLSSAVSYRTGALQTAERAYALQLPAEANPRSRALAQQWRGSTSDDAALVEQALAYLHNEPFFYTREPPPLGNDPVDQFLFVTRQGFCEHYAAAFVTLMRAAGIPARVVTGYQGGEFNAVGNFLEIRQNLAHAWAEVWLAGQGWVRVDPAAVIPAERVIAQQDSLRFQSTASAATTAQDLALFNSALRKLRQGWQAVNYSWSVWVIGFNAERQQALLKKWGFGKVELPTLLGALLISIGISFVMIALLFLYRQPRIDDPVLKLYQHFCRRLAKAGIDCPAHEGPQQLAARAIAALPQHAATIRSIIDRYVALRYGGSSPNQLIELKRSIRRFRP